MIRFSYPESESTSPCVFRSSGKYAIPAFMASAGVATSSVRPPLVIVPLSSGSAPKMARVTSVRPAPTRPARPSTSPARTSKLIFSKAPCREAPRTLSTVVTDLGVSRREHLAQRTADHQLDQLTGAGHFGGGERRDATAAAQHRDAVSDAADFLKPVRNEQNCRALVAHLAQDAKKGLEVAVRQGRRGFVQNDHRRALNECAGDFHDLLLSSGQGRGRPARVYRRALVEAVEDFGGRLLRPSPRIELPERAGAAARRRARCFPRPSYRGRSSVPGIW